MERKTPSLNRSEAVKLKNFREGVLFQMGDRQLERDRKKSLDRHYKERNWWVTNLESLKREKTKLFQQTDVQSIPAPLKLRTSITSPDLSQIDQPKSLTTNKSRPFTAVARTTNNNRKSDIVPTTITYKKRPGTAFATTSNNKQTETISTETSHDNEDVTPIQKLKNPKIFVDLVDSDNSGEEVTPVSQVPHQTVRRKSLCVDILPRVPTDAPNPEILCKSEKNRIRRLSLGLNTGVATPLQLAMLNGRRSSDDLSLRSTNDINRVGGKVKLFVSRNLP